MAAVTTLSVDGQHGIDIARNSSARPTGSTSLPLRTADATSLDGADGADADAATPGGPGGFLAIQLSSLSRSSEGFLVNVIGQSPPDQVQQRTEVAAQRDLLLSAVGGNGEPGRKGGNGERGRTGRHGSPANRDDDAGTGGNGGKGGNAGSGSHGANGGDGGSVHIIVNENVMHLLYAVKWLVHGGLGGAPGDHGEPGQGGPGGPGGTPFEWTQQIGYDFRCTENCVGASSASVARRAIVNRPASANLAVSKMMGRMGPQIVQGSNFQSMIAQTAMKYRNFSASSAPTERSDACRCKGGPEGCVGCEKRPIQQTYTRPKGPDGQEGGAGTAIHDSLRPGLQGNNGSISIIVDYAHQERQTYHSCYKLQLVGFDIEDENEDGIYEPGEHIYIRRIRIRNAGGMPSPKCPIPIRILPSAAVISLDGEQSQTFIPSSIQPNRIATVDGFIKAKLRIPQIRASPEPYVSHCDISLTATMPYLDRQLDEFDTSKRITIQYPVDLREFHMLPNVAQGSRTDFSWNIKNKGAKKVGLGVNSIRQVRMNMSLIPAASGHLLTRKLGLEDIHGTDTTVVEPNNTLSVKQTVQVSDNVEDYSDIVLRVTLSISAPESTSKTSKFRDVQCCDLKIRVSSLYQYNEYSSFLVVTNEKTTRSQLLAVQHLIQDELGSQMDIWNVALYGGLQHPNPDDEKVVLDILGNYKKGVTFIFLEGSFDFYGMGLRSILHLSAPSLVARAFQKDISCLFLGLLNEANARFWTQLMAYPILSYLQEVLSQTATSSTLANEEFLVQSLTQMKAHENIALATYILPVQKKWYLSNTRSLDHRAKEVASYLRRSLPQERFWVCPTELGKTGEQELVGKLAIFHGTPLSARSVITERRDLRGADGPSASAMNLAAPTTRLSLLDQYSCIQALSIPSRIDLILRQPNMDTVAQASGSSFATTAATWTLIEDFDTEIHAFLHNATSLASTSFSSPAENEQRGFAIHLPAVATWFSHPQSAFPEEQPLSENVILILQYLLASSSTQKKRHTVARLLPPFQTRRSALHAFLQTKIAAFLTNRGQTDAETKGFLAQWKSWRAKELGGARSTADAIARSVVPLLKTSEHVYRAGRVRAGDVGLERTRVCTKEEWDARAKAVQLWEKKMGEDGERARAKLREFNAGKEIGDDRV